MLVRCKSPWSDNTALSAASSPNLILAKDQNAYSGKFMINQYDESGNLLAHPARLSNQMDE